MQKYKKLLKMYRMILSICIMSVEWLFIPKNDFLDNEKNEVHKSLFTTRDNIIQSSLRTLFLNL